ncbi:MAG: mechanosensitive ion channel family protein [Trueperaceae bacterium]|nr:mechanosensitive ion channel family protein [Trueperaceae bacterium]
MSQVSGFFTKLWSEVIGSLGDTFGLFSDNQEALVIALANLINQLIIVSLLGVVFTGVYYLLRTLLRFLLGRLRLLKRSIAAPLFVALRYTVVVLAGLAILAQFGVEQNILANIARAAVLAFLFYLGWIIGGRLLNNFLQRYQLDASLEQLVRNIYSVLLVTFAVTTVLAQLGVQVFTVVASLGVVGIAVGFAAQDTLSNFIAGITLLLERPFKIGDWVEISGYVGRVRSISLRTTRLSTRDNVLTSIPNAQVLSNRIANYSGGGPLRVRIPVGIAYKESAKAARKVMLPILEEHRLVMDTRRPEVRMTSLGASSVDLELHYWLEPEQIGVQPKISADLLEQCKEALDDAGIEIPFPHLQLFIDEAKGLAPLVEPFQNVRHPGTRGDLASENEPADES